MMLATPYYARKPANTTRNLNRIIFPAIVVLAVAAAGAWFLMTPSQTSPNDQATVSTTTTATNTQVAPSAPYMTPGGASPIADPIAAVNPPALTPAPARIAAPPRAAPARTARAQPERVASGRRTTVARTSRSAPNAEDSSADVAARVPTDVSPAPPPLAAPAPPPMISAPAMTPPADPTGAVNPPIQ